MFLVVNFHMMVNNYMKTMKWFFLKSCSSHFSWFFIHSRKKLLKRNWPLCFTITWWFSLYLLPPTFPVVTFRCCATQTNWFQMVLELVSIYSPHETRLSASSVSQLFPFAVVTPCSFFPCSITYLPWPSKIIVLRQNQFNSSRKFLLRQLDSKEVSQ